MRTTPTPERTAAPAAKATVYLPSQVDTEPKPLEMTMPIYPAKALRERIRGVVVLRVLVSETGVPLEVRVERGAREDLNEAAIEAAKQWRFEPAMKGGRAVRSYARVRFPFEGVQFARTPLPGFAVTP